MPQLHLPMFPNGVTHITDQLAFTKENGRVVYFNGYMPVFSHAEDDLASFRMITSQFCVNGYVKQSDVIRTFGVTSISVKRWVKKFREEGPKAFYAPRPVRGAAILVEDVVAKAEELLAEGTKISEVAEKLNVKKNTLQKAVRAGRVREPVKKNNSMHTLLQMA
jgi:transposase